LTGRARARDHLEAHPGQAVHPVERVGEAFAWIAGEDEAHRGHQGADGQERGRDRPKTP